MTTPAPTGETAALYLADGDRYVPTVFTQGPWDPDAQHGGPVAALLTHVIDRVPTLVPMRVARLTVDLFRPAPLRILGARHRIVREGKRIQLVESVLLDGDLEVAHCLGLRIRTGDTSGDDVMAHPSQPSVAPPRPPSGDGPPLHPGSRESAVGFIRAIDAERVVGDVGLGAPSIMWVRMRVPLIADAPTAPIERLALAADFTSALASFLDGRHFSFINPDINIHVLRDPASEWIGIDSVTWVGAEGVGQGRSSLYDLGGLVGNASAAQVVERWDRPQWGRAPEDPAG
ncbi:MAG TPA: thioesterase family protein [Acidimicrobiales bacterium]|nr:thioesterase family protein [Acidimicrobiales bacterium]